jgi:hypothetical protein
MSVAQRFEGIGMLSFFINRVVAFVLMGIQRQSNRFREGSIYFLPRESQSRVRAMRLSPILQSMPALVLSGLANLNPTLSFTAGTRLGQKAVLAAPSLA